MNDWRADGACRSEPQALFFPERGQSIAAALSICAGCPVLLECRTWGLYHEKIGIWGGTSERERRRLRRQLGIRLREITIDDDSWKPARAAHLHRQGWRPAEIAIELHAETRTVHRWLTAEGIDAYPPPTDEPHAGGMKTA